MPPTPPDHALPPPPLADVPEGSCSFDLVLGDVRVRVENLPTPWSPYVDAEFHLFAKPPDSAALPDVTVQCRYESRPHVIAIQRPGQSTQLEIRRDGPNRFYLASHWHEGIVELSTRSAELTLVSRDWIRFRMSLENALRVIFQLVLIDRGLFLMHTAGIVDAARAFLFFGHSGAGKSTATHFSAPRPALSDDMVLIDMRGATATAEAVPFYGAMLRELRHAGRYPIAAALRLRQAPDDRLERLSLARAVATVGGSVPFVHEFGVSHDGLTDLIARFCSRVTVCDLHFTKSARFWHELDREFPG